MVHAHVSIGDHNCAIGFASEVVYYNLQLFAYLICGVLNLTIGIKVTCAVVHNDLWCSL